MLTPGFYKTDHRKLTLRELVRWSGLWRVPVLYLATRKRPANAGFWMPALWADLECPQGELSNRFWAATAGQRKVFDQLGFESRGFARIKPSLNLQPLHRDNGKITYLSADGLCVGGILYSRFCAPPINQERELIVIWFTAVFDEVIVSCTNNRRSFDPVQPEQTVRVSADDPAFIHAQLMALCQGRNKAPRTFRDDQSLRDWFDRYVTNGFEARVKRGLFVKMTDQEIAEARSRMPPATWTTSSQIPPVK